MPRLLTLALLAAATWLGGSDALAADCDPAGAPSAAVDARALLAQMRARRPIHRRAPPAPAEPEAAPEPESHRPGPGKMRDVYDANEERAEDWKEKLSKQQQSDLDDFYDNWEKNKSRYETVAAETGIPAALIAALHWRESTGDFTTYLHQGDPLGKKAVHVPKDIPLFHKWEPAAEHALDLKKSIRDDLSITEDTTDLAALATYAEYYNGLGYYNRDKPSPYVWAGTDQYTRGKYVSDGRYSSVTKDKQLGVVAMVQHIWDEDAKKAAGGG